MIRNRNAGCRKNAKKCEKCERSAESAKEVRNGCERIQIRTL